MYVLCESDDTIKLLRLLTDLPHNIGVGEVVDTSRRVKINHI